MSFFFSSARKRTAQNEVALVKREQAAQREELSRMQEEAKLWAQEQYRLAAEQMRLAEEQEKQAAQLAKHEEQIAKLQYSVAKCQFDIDFLNERIANLDAMRDNLMRKQSACALGSDEWDKYQKKVLVLDNQIHAAEAKLGKSQFDMTLAKSKLSA